MNLRVSKVFRLGGRARIEAIGEVFNLFNAVEPEHATAAARRSCRRTAASGSDAARSRPPSRATSGVPNSASASSASGLCSNAARPSGPPDSRVGGVAWVG